RTTRWRIGELLLRPSWTLSALDARPRRQSSPGFEELAAHTRLRRRPWKSRRNHQNDLTRRTPEPQAVARELGELEADGPWARSRGESTDLATAVDLRMAVGIKGPSGSGSGEQGLDELLWFEVDEIRRALPQADELDGQVEIALDGKSDPTLGRAVQLGED